MTTRPRIVRKLRLTEVSGVITPANSAAEFILAKRKEPQMSDITAMAAEMSKALETIQTLTDKVREADERAAAAEAKAALAEAKVVSVSKAAEKGAADDADDPVLKAADPAVAAEIVKLRKANALALRQLAEMDSEREMEALTKSIAADYPSLPVKPSEFAPVLKAAFGSLSADHAKELRRVLKAASNAIEDAARGRGLLGVLAKSDAETEMDAKARDISAKENVSIEKAHTLAMERNPDLYSRYLAERGSVQ